MSIESRTSGNRAKINVIETKLMAQGYGQVAASQRLKPYEYYRNEYSGTPCTKNQKLSKNMKISIAKKRLK